jgi:hypothetical protein
MFPKRAEAAKLAGRIPPVLVTTQELRNIRVVKDPGQHREVHVPIMWHSGLCGLGGFLSSNLLPVVN